MKLKYRIKIIKYPTAPTAYIPQYKIMGIWFGIDVNMIGHLISCGSVYCETFDDAYNRIRQYQINMLRSKEHIYSEVDKKYWCLRR